MGQLSDDRQWWWDGARWTPARLSPDKKWHWDGTAWQRVDPKRPAHAPRGERGATKDRLDLDPARFGAGEMPDYVDQLPGRPSVQMGFVAIGWGWVARRVVRWHMITLPEVQAVAVVPPAHWDEDALVEARQGPLPDLALRDFFGHCLRIETGQLVSAARKELLSQVPMSAHVTAIAEEFLEEGTLPGKWGQRLESFGPR